jgi:site-specific recombinase XerD
VNTLSRQFSEILKKSGIVSGSERHTSQGKGRNTKRKKSRLSFHSLRHSAVTLLKEAGVSNAVVMELIGHESEAISRAYTHMGEAALRAAVNKLPDITANTENA